MFYIEDDVVYLTRGDDAALTVTIKTEAGGTYQMQAGDVLTMTVRKRPDDEDEVIFTTQSGTERLLISHVDTAQAEPGAYSADVQLTMASGQRRTVWPELSGKLRKSARNFENFIIMPEVTTV